MDLTPLDSDLRHTAQPVTETSFGETMIALCRELEQWRTECQSDLDASSDSLPPWDWKAASHSLIFGIGFLLASYAVPFVASQPSTVAKLALILSLTVSFAAWAVFLFFGAFGMAKRKFWSALWASFVIPKDNYPFTSLLRCIEHELGQQERLRPFPESILRAAEQRIHLEETELRERLNATVGTPTLLVLFGIGTGTVTSWNNYHSHPHSWINGLIFAGSILALLIGAYGLKLRISLIELSRCRALLALEMARRAREP